MRQSTLTTFSLDAIRSRVSTSILVRPAMFVLGGLALAWFTLQLDALFGASIVPESWRMPAGNVRTLYSTLAGATLTVAGITFWVRAASVQLAASQYSPRVLQGFLQDWFQQSMMGLLLGIFAYLVSVFRYIPDLDGAAAGATLPHLSVLVGIALAGGSVLVVLVAIRNGVRSMQAGELARRITDLTVERIRETLPRPSLGDGGERPDTTPPVGRGFTVRSVDSGWVQRIDEDGLLGLLPAGAVVRLEVRVGLFVVPDRPVCRVWSHHPLEPGTEERLVRCIRLGRSRTMGADIHYGIQQLVDVALGSLWRNTADSGAAYEAIVHLEIVLRELSRRNLASRAREDDQGRKLFRHREFSFSDYVNEAFDRLRLAAAPHPTVAVAIMETIGSLVRELEFADRPGRVAHLRRQARLTMAACEAADLLEADLAQVRHVALRHGLIERSVGGGEPAGPDLSGAPVDAADAAPATPSWPAGIDPPRELDLPGSTSGQSP